MKYTLTPQYRIYAKGKPYKLIGLVEAHTEEEALEKALKGIWKGYWAEEGYVMPPSDKLAVHY